MKNKILKLLLVLLLCVSVIAGLNAYEIKSEAAVPVTRVSLSKTSVVINSGNATSLTATVYPYNATNRTVTWRSTNSVVASVSNNGVITAKTVGTTTIIATSNNGKTASCVVTVKELPVSSVYLNKSSASIQINNTVYLSATVYPSYATNKKLVWSSDNSSVASVNQNGVVTGYKVGTATITAKANNGVKATCKITVTGIKVQNLSVKMDNLYVKGKNVKLVATVSPSNATNRKITWSSSNTRVATIDQDGTLHPLSYGTTKITATCANNEASYTKEIKVSEYDPIDYVYLSSYSKSLTVGDVWTLQGFVSPSYANNTKLTWTTSSPWVATVQNGTIKALAEGTTTITATSHDGKKATCTVTVKGVPVSRVTLSKTTLSMSVNSIYSKHWTLTATVSPYNASNKNVTWTSSNTRVATVTSSGYVTAVSPGTTVITAKTSNGRSAYCTVTVTK